MSEKRLNRLGQPMRAAIVQRIIETLANPLHDGKSQLALARLAGVSVRTLRSYSTPALLADVAALRHRWLTPNALLDVDRAMLAKAREGNVAAARLIYARLEHTNLRDGELPTLDELEEEIRRLKDGK